MKKLQSCYTVTQRVEGVTTCRVQEKRLGIFSHYLSKEHQCFELLCAETSGVKKKKVLLIHMQLN